MFRRIFTTLTIFTLVFATHSVRVPPNPCPGVFQYYKSANDNQIYGEVKVPYDGAEHLNMNLNGSFAALLPKMKFTIKMITNIRQLLARTENVIYEVYFPTQTVLPRITRIEYNGQLFCVGPQEPVIPGEEGTTNLWSSQSFTFHRPANYVPQELDGTDSSSIPTKGLTTKRPVTSLPTEVDTKDSIYIPSKGYDIVTPTATRRPTLPESTLPTIRPGGKRQCGISNMAVPLIVGGTENLGRYPWLAAVMIRDEAKQYYGYKCSANLITEKHVLTAGRCIQYYDIQIPTETILIIMGTNDLANWDTNGAVTRKAKKVLVHPDFKKLFLSANADVALITFDSPISVTNKVSPVCLWGNKNTELAPLFNKTGTLVGWSSDKTDSVNISSMPKSAHLDMPIVPQWDCLTQEGATPDIITERTFCAGDDSRTGSCVGDSGSGFVIRLNDIYYLRGVASLSIMKENKCDLNSYSIFCDVAKYKDWLMDAMFESRITVKSGP